MAHESRRVVLAALAGNTGIAVAKFVAAVLTGSAAMLAEAFHSVADTGNQALLLLGMRLARRAPTADHPFGYEKERYFWAFIVAVTMFFVGGCLALWEGIHKVMAPGAPGEALAAYVVLGISMVLEATSFTVALKGWRALHGRTTVREVVAEAKDPTVPLVLFEDAAALIGLLLALVGIVLAQLTGSTFWDGAASISIGVLLCAVAVVLAQRTRQLLLGEAVSPEHTKRLGEIIATVPGVRRLIHLRTMHLGPDTVLLATKVEFGEELHAHEIEQAIDELERRVRGEMPEMRYIFVEAGSGGTTTCRVARVTEVPPGPPSAR
jgi:cation diffusion facilitator family transporter